MAENVTASSERYAQSLVVDVAEVSDVNKSRVNDIIVMESPVDGQSPTT